VVNLDGVRHRTYVNQELGTFYHLFYPGVVTAGPMGAQDIHQPWHLTEHGGEDVLGECHTPFREIGNEASIRVSRMFKSHAWQQYDKQMQCY
jgi:hypothetical protein